MKQSLRLGTISGIPVGVHWGLVVVAALYLFTLGGQVLPAAAPDAGSGAHWLVAAGGVVVFFASILAHELGHSLVAQREGIGVRAITLWLLGGVAEIERDATTPGAEFRIAVAGPAVSLALGVVFVGAGVGYEAVFGPSLIVTMAWWLGIVNVFLAVFNLLPAAPLDGGRVLTSVLWWRSGDPHRARAQSARAGQVFAGILLAVGTWQLLAGDGVWMLILAWFIQGGATSERRRAQVMGRAAHTTIGAAMARLVPTDGAVTVAGLAAMGGAGGSVAFSVRQDGHVIGIVPPATVAEAVRRGRGTMAARDLVVPWSQFVGARADERAVDVVDRAMGGDDLHVLVYDAAGNHAGYVGTAELFAMAAPAGARRSTTVGSA